MSTFVDDEDYRTLNLGSYNWNPIIGRNTTYAKTYKKGGTIYLHRLIMGLLDATRSVFVDHIDGNGLNNYRTNIRVTNNMGNQRNARKRLSAKTSSPYKGVCFDADKSKSPWVARITLSGKQKHLGCYRTEIEAARAYNQAAMKIFGPYAFLNELPD